MIALNQNEIAEFTEATLGAKRTQYSYALLRYVHDVATGEFVNVGVVIYAPTIGYFDYQVRRSRGRIFDVVPDLKASSLKAVVRTLTRRLDELTSSTRMALKYGDSAKSFEQLVASVLPKDDSALIWANSGTGVAANVPKVLERLYERYAAKYDRAPTSNP